MEDHSNCESSSRRTDQSLVRPPTTREQDTLPPPLLVTVDTNVLDIKRIGEIRAAARDRAVRFATVTVNERERGEFSVEVDVLSETAVWGESRWGEAVLATPIPESMVLDETPLGSGVLASDEGADMFEQVLAIISNGSFPRPGTRDALTAPQRRQLRDAMTFEAHCRHGRHVFISEDKKAFINHGRREALESIGRTKILTVDEFMLFVRSGPSHT